MGVTDSVKMLLRGKRSTKSAALLFLAIVVLVARAEDARNAEPSQQVEVYVWGQQPTSAATEQTRWAKDLELRPSTAPSDVMRLTPSVLIGQHHGGGKADQILFRGFDAD